VAGTSARRCRENIKHTSPLFSVACFGFHRSPEHSVG
jgi:hypothetical protein